MRRELRTEYCHPFPSCLKAHTSKIMGKSEESKEKWNKYGSEKAGASKVSMARRQPGGSRVVNSQAKTRNPCICDHLS